MAVIRLARLGGVLPAASARALPDGAAQVSDNLLARTMEFRPLADDAAAATLPLADPQTLYHPARKADGSLNTDLSQGWFASADALSYARGQIDDGATERIYYASTTGATAPRVRDAAGLDKRLGVPPPASAPTVVPQAVYTFTPEQKVIEKQQVHQRVMQLVDQGTAPVTVGLGGTLPAKGWLRRSDFESGPAAEKALVRIFALDPATKQVIDTYSAMTPAEAAWIFDPALGGDYSEKPPGFVLPAWAAGHSLWWVIRLTAFARAYQVNVPALTASLQTIDMPGTQGAQKYVNAHEAGVIAQRLADKYDATAPAVRALVDTLDDRQRKVAVLFNQGGAEAVKRATQDFYARADIASSIEAAKNTFAETIWRYAEAIGKATSKPWYAEGGDT